MALWERRANQLLRIENGTAEPTNSGFVCVPHMSQTILGKNSSLSNPSTKKLNGRHSQALDGGTIYIWIKTEWKMISVKNEDPTPWIVSALP